MGNRWDEKYLSGQFPELGPEPMLAAAASAASVGDALDLACGRGRHSLWLARRGWRVTAVDYSNVALESLRQQSENLPVCTVQADLEKGEYTIEPARFNLIVDTCFLFRPLFEAIRKGIAPAGVFFGVFPLEGINPDFLLKENELRDAFSDWEILYDFEGRPSCNSRSRAELIARKPIPA